MHKMILKLLWGLDSHLTFLITKKTDWSRFTNHKLSAHIISHAADIYQDDDDFILDFKNLKDIFYFIDF